MSAAALLAPVCAHGKGDDQALPLVVLLHGRGSNESEIVRLADHLPDGAQYVALRAPIAENGGFAWFANRGIGRPVAESLRSTMDWFRAWLAEVAPPGRPVLLVGFSGGAAFAGGLVLDDRPAYAGAAVLNGTLPFEAGLPVDDGRLAGLPVFLAHSDEDQVIPRDLLDRTWDYLLTQSGAHVLAHRVTGGHQVTPETVGELAGWISRTLSLAGGASSGATR